MKILVNDDIKIKLYLPTRIAAWGIIKYVIKDDGTNKKPSVGELTKELKKARKNFGKLKLVEITNKEGKTIVEITL